jgi:ammonia channel protein AmtB
MKPFLTPLRHHRPIFLDYGFNSHELYQTLGAFIAGLVAVSTGAGAVAAVGAFAAAAAEFTIALAVMGNADSDYERKVNNEVDLLKKAGIPLTWPEAP